jgi:hypothetical protein
MVQQCICFLKRESIVKTVYFFLIFFLFSSISHAIELKWDEEQKCYMKGKEILFCEHDVEFHVSRLKNFDMELLCKAPNIVYIKYDGGSIINFDKIGCLKNLQVLFVEDISGIKNLKVLSKFKKLHSLVLKGIGISIYFNLSLVSKLDLVLLGIENVKLKNLQEIRNITSLKYLAINNNSLAIDFNLFKKLKNLEELTLFDNEIINFSAIVNLGNLRVLGLKRIKAQDVKYLSEMKKLRMLGLTEKFSEEAQLELNKIKNLSVIIKK